MKNGDIRTCRGFTFIARESYSEIFDGAYPIECPLDLMIARGQGFPLRPFDPDVQFLKNLKKCHVDWLSKITIQLREDPRFSIVSSYGKDYAFVHRNDNVSAKFSKGGGVEFCCNYNLSGAWKYEGGFVPESTRSQFMQQISEIIPKIERYLDIKDEFEQLKADFRGFLETKKQCPAVCCHVY